jgi:adenosylhomocysteine nucleosidase
MKKKECLIVIAHSAELNDDFKKLNDQLLITGVGKVNATYQLTKKLTELRLSGKSPKYVINMGSSGSKHYKKGSLVYCHQFIQHDMDASAFTKNEKCQTPGDNCVVLEHKDLIKDLPKAICGTGDCFITTQTIDNRVQVVEMEAYALARVCKMEGIDFIAIKYITDGLDENGGNDWKKEVKSSADIMYEYLTKLWN